MGSLRRRSEFALVRETGRRTRTGVITVTFCSNGNERKLACAISRRVGNAVVRNKLRRRIRAILSENDVAPGMYLVSVGVGAGELSFGDLQEMVLLATRESAA